MNHPAAQPFSYRREAHRSGSAYLLMHIEAGVNLVRQGGIRNGFDQDVREDFTSVALLGIRRAGDPLPALDFALNGGEPYSRWI